MTYQTIVLEVQYDCHSHRCVCAFWWTLDNSIHWKQQRNNRDESLLIVSVTGQFTTWPFQLVKSIIILLLRFLFQVFRQQETHSTTFWLSLPAPFSQKLKHMKALSSICQGRHRPHSLPLLSVGSYSLWTWSVGSASARSLSVWTDQLWKQRGKFCILCDLAAVTCEVTARATVHANNCNQREWLSILINHITGIINTLYYFKAPLNELPYKNQ